MIGTKLAMSSTYHSQTNGQIEIVNKCLEGYLCWYSSNKQSQWMKFLRLVEWWYNVLSPNIGSLPLNWGILFYLCWI